VTPDLSDADCALLRRIAGGGDPSSANVVDDPDERLSELADGGLVRRTDDGEEYALTPSGQRVLHARGDDPTGDAADRPATVEQDIAALDLDPGEREAVRRAVAFLRNWEAATESELVDAVFDEAPAGHDDPEEWWTELVRDPLAEVQGVASPDDGDGHGEWRYEDDGSPEVAEADADGRHVLAADEDRYGSAKHAIEREADDDAETEALSAAFEVLAEDDAGTGEDLAAVLEEFDRDLDAVADSLTAIPGVEREGDRWRYAPPDRESEGERNSR
jgi:hypothetical protein